MQTPNEIARLALSLMDLTSLNDNDTNQSIIDLCNKAATEAGNVAAVCIYSQFIEVGRKALNEAGLEGFSIATVTNFPAGGDDIEVAKQQTADAVQAGADEVDLVLPYKAVINGNYTVAAEMVKACKEICRGKAVLKVIIESGELKKPNLIAMASDIALDNGADFIKTSTGKVPVNATLEATEIMLGRIKASGREDVGFKAAGGIRSLEDATAYLKLTAEIMGEEWITPEHFRFGASGLLDNLLHSLGLTDKASDASY